MAQYSKASSVGGEWLNKESLRSGMRVKILTEAVPTEEEFQGRKRTRSIVKLKVEGDNDPKNFDLNKPTVNGLIDAFGTDSKDWMNKVLTAHVEKMLIAGKRQTAVYLVPEGFEVAEDSGGYLVVQRMGSEPAASKEVTEADFAVDTEEINPEDIPF